MVVDLGSARIQLLPACWTGAALFTGLQAIMMATTLRWLELCLRALKQAELVAAQLGADVDELKLGLAPLFKTKKFLALAGGFLSVVSAHDI